MCRSAVCIDVRTIRFIIDNICFSSELGSDGRILVRESGTEPVIRVMVEAATDEICEKYVNSVVKVIEDKGLTE